MRSNASQGLVDFGREGEWNTSIFDHGRHAV